jgi:hypothetical protein
MAMAVTLVILIAISNEGYPMAVTFLVIPIKRAVHDQFSKNHSA